MKNAGLTKTDSLALKGIAIILMIFHHLFCETKRFDAYNVSFFPFTQDFVVNVSLMMKICVSIFAFITGYGLFKSISVAALKRKDIAVWTVKRLLKTMSGFYFIYIITFLITLIIDGLPLKTYFANGAFKGIIYIFMDFLGISSLFGTPRLIATWWYMSAAVIFIIITPIINMVSRKIGYLPIIVSVIALPRLLNIGYTGGTNPYSFILPLVIGMMFSDYEIFERMSENMPKNKALSYIVNFVFFTCAIIFFYFFSVKFETSDFWEVKFALAPVFFICFFRYCVIRIPVIRNILEYLGKRSMTVFLTHNFIRYTYLNRFTYSFGNFLKIFAVLFLLSFALAAVLDFIKSIIKYDELFEKIINKTTKIIQA